ncbi:VacJ family lipoprotein [Ramlibacter rhizophilus]|uniref:VacJ family lipoprotein n=1 Tax=Ramlibacter rhizophilus TaxID=1781167 RepID=A0A4Z0BMY7_9BURK|nr:VacJ family lipoprotein [Ramlibacter rhizophilus]TFY99617.1 VacJ family lipoprotein [Ramlibacter rhizophilus]
MISSVFRLLSLLVVALALGACAAGPDPRDPLEPWNRKVSDFNEAVDSIVLKPAAIGYREALPPLVRTGVSNFFANLGDAWSTVNNALQLRPHHAAESWLRFGVNTFFGLGGVLDIASDMGIERHREDFGQTLGRWGVDTGPYIVLPLLGPSTLRDTLALPVDRWGDPVRLVNPDSLETGLYALRAVDVRANLLRASSVLDAVALDKYSFTRDAFLQRRRAQIYRPDAQVDPQSADEDFSR